jgi:hypothetical protein
MMEQFLAAHGDAVLSAVVGALGGSLFTLRLNRNSKAGGDLVDQSRATAGRDIIGKDNSPRT